MSETAAPVITPKYAELNAELHTREERYGSGAHRRRDAIVELMGEYEADDVLDYGCGKGTLAQVMPGVEIREYDPAIAGKDGRPEPADLVACLDVLEHVEPELLDNVLRDLNRLTKKVLFCAISTIRSSQTLADGRNAHLIVEPVEWWEQRLAPFFKLRMRYVNEGEFIFAAEPLHEIGAIKSLMAVTAEVRNEQMALNCARCSQRIGDRAPLPAHSHRAILLCFGPSLSDTIADAKLDAMTDPNAQVFTVSATHKFAIENGIIPYAQLDCDPRAHKVTQMGYGHPDVLYWLASCVHPSYLDHLEGMNVSLWHAYNGEESHRALRDIDPEAHMIVGGGSIGLRALSLLYSLGYRKFTVHGMDCSFRGQLQHAGEHHGKRKPMVEMTTPDGRVFVSSPALVLYYRYFFKQLYWMHDATVELAGDGMLQHAMGLWNHGANARD